MKLLTSLTLLVQLSLFSFDSQQSAKNGMFSDLEFFRSTFNAQYAPMEWKASFSNWDIDEAIEKARLQVQGTSDIEVKDYQRILRDFFVSLGDYHANVQFFSTEAAYLPIQFRGANGKYYITQIDLRFLKGTKLTAIKPGDELLLINDKSVESALAEFQKQEFNAYLTPTDISNSERDFSLRLGALGHKVPSGDVTVVVKHRATKETKKYQLSWIYSPERVANIIPKGAKSLQVAKKPEGSKSAIFRSMLYSKYKALKEAPYKMDKDSIGSRISFVPDLGDKIWTSAATCPFYAYIFKTPSKKLVGYVRIPTFDASTKEAAQFREIIKRFEDKTDAIVVDQVNNPGGSMFYMYTLASCLTNKPLVVPKHRVALTQSEVYESIERLDYINSGVNAKDLFGNDIDGYPMTQTFINGLKKSIEFDLNEWSQGKLLTDPASLYGIDQITPDNTGRYSKPILFLINELDYSCGDFLPAILQDNKRATLFGTRTAGAGGFVLTATHPNLFGVDSFSYTGSIAQRVDLNPIENLGVHPDIEYQITEEDLIYSYRGYARRLLEELEKILKK